MKITAYTALLYGIDWLPWAIRSVIDYVDQYVVIYSSIGSHGTRTDTPCPESREDLYAVARRVAGDKLVWYDGVFPYEGAQRDTIFQIARDADAVIALDADEIWGESLIKATTDYIRSNDAPLFPVRYLRIPMIHFWRSVRRAILHDPAYPYRVIFPYTPVEWGEETMFHDKTPILHMGYAQRPETVNFKLKVHGHISQFRTDIDWFRERYMNPAAKTDLHPVGSQYWDWEAVNPDDYFPAWMHDHPFWNMEVIE